MRNVRRELDVSLSVSGFQVIAPVHTNQTVIRAGWPREVAFIEAYGARTEELRSWFDANAQKFWPGLNLVYADIWALDHSGFDLEDFRFFKKSGELRVNARIDSRRIASLEPARQALAVHIVLLQSVLVACARYRIASHGIEHLLEAASRELGAPLADVGLPETPGAFRH